MATRIVLFPIPLQGHINPMMQLATILHSKGFEISIIWISSNPLDPSKRPEFSFHTISRGVSEMEALTSGIRHRIATMEVSTNDFSVLFTTFNNVFIDPFRECLSQIVSDAESSGKERVACLVTDLFWYSTQAVADSLNIPRIGLQAANLVWLLSFSVCQQIRELGSFSMEGLIPLEFKETLLTFSEDDSDKKSHIEFVSELMRETKASRGLIINSFKEIEDFSLAITQKEFPIPILPCGPFHKSLPSTLSNDLPNQDKLYMSWLDTQAPNSVLYVSFGSLAAIDEVTLVEIAWGLANSNQPFLWVVRTDFAHILDKPTQLLRGFIEETSGRGRIVSWAQQMDVLAHPAVGGFWTHCGWNSTLESICEGIPMICSPFFVDQILNAGYVSDVWKVGLLLEKESKRDGIEKAIRKLMSKVEGEEMRQRALCLKKKARNGLLPNGSSYEYMEDLLDLISSF